VSNIQANFYPVWVYLWELIALSYPADSADTAPYPYYDRWCDDWNVSTEGSTTDMARSFAATAWLAARTSLAGQSWRSANASISGTEVPRQPGRPITLTVNVPGAALETARITWEAEAREPVFSGATYTFIPQSDPGVHWVEAEIHWPDGRRAFATGAVTVSTSAPPELTSPHRTPTGGLSFTLAGAPLRDYVIQVSADLAAWEPMITVTLPANGLLSVTVPQTTSPSRFYRALLSQ
jgi:hypothetical protein